MTTLDRWISLLASALLLGCGGTSSKPPSSPDMAQAGGPAVVGFHGVVVDYFSGMPQVGFTVTNGTDTATTDANGVFLLPAPMGATVAASVTGPTYSMLYLAGGTAAGPDVDYGNIPIPAVGTLTLEQNIVASDSTKALAQVTFRLTGNCTSIKGGTITVNSPPGTSVAYFSTAGLPTAMSMSDATGNKPGAVIYNIEPGATLDVTTNVAGCTQEALGTAHNGVILTGQVKTAALEPGDNNSSLVVVLH